MWPNNRTIVFANNWPGVGPTIGPIIGLVFANNWTNNYAANPWGYQLLEEPDVVLRVVRLVRARGAS